MSPISRFLCLACVIIFLGDVHAISKSPLSREKLLELNYAFINVNSDARESYSCSRICETADLKECKSTPLLKLHPDLKGAYLNWEKVEYKTNFYKVKENSFEIKDSCYCQRSAQNNFWYDNPKHQAKSALHALFHSLDELGKDLIKFEQNLAIYPFFQEICLINPRNIKKFRNLNLNIKNEFYPAKKNFKDEFEYFNLYRITAQLKDSLTLPLNTFRSELEKVSLKEAFTAYYDKKIFLKLFGHHGKTYKEAISGYEHFKLGHNGALNQLNTAEHLLSYLVAMLSPTDDVKFEDWDKAVHNCVHGFRFPEGEYLDPATDFKKEIVAYPYANIRSFLPNQYPCVMLCNLISFDERESDSNCLENPKFSSRKVNSNIGYNITLDKEHRIVKAAFLSQDAIHSKTENTCSCQHQICKKEKKRILIPLQDMSKVSDLTGKTVRRTTKIPSKKNGSKKVTDLEETPPSDFELTQSVEETDVSGEKGKKKKSVPDKVISKVSKLARKIKGKSSKKGTMTEENASEEVTDLEETPSADPELMESVEETDVSGEKGKKKKSVPDKVISKVSKLARKIKGKGSKKGTTTEENASEEVTDLEETPSADSELTESVEETDVSGEKGKKKKVWMPKFKSKASKLGE